MRDTMKRFFASKVVARDARLREIEAEVSKTSGPRRFYPPCVDNNPKDPWNKAVAEAKETLRS